MNPWYSSRPELYIIHGVCSCIRPFKLVVFSAVNQHWVIFSHHIWHSNEFKSKLCIKISMIYIKLRPFESRSSDEIQIYSLSFKEMFIWEWKLSGSNARTSKFQESQSENTIESSYYGVDQFTPALFVLPFTAFHFIYFIHTDQLNPQHWNAKISVIGCYCCGSNSFYNINKMLRKS